MKQYQQECEGSVKPEFFLANEEQELSESDDREYSDDGYIELSDNEVIMKFSITLMNKLKKSAFEEGIEIDELAAELIIEGLAQRAVVDANRPGPSHLMTRTGYLSPDSNGQNMSQPLLSHHQGNGSGNRNVQNRSPRGRSNNRRGPQQQRNGSSRGGPGNNAQRPHHQGGGNRGRGRV